MLNTNYIPMPLSENIFNWYERQIDANIMKSTS